MAGQADAQWNILVKVSACLVPVLIPAIFAFGAWSVGEIYAGKYERLTQDDEIRIKAEVEERFQSNFDLLREDIKTLREGQQEILQRLPGNSGI